jgi:hypothetical protein
MTTVTNAIRRRLDDLATAARTGADALDGAALDLPEGTLALVVTGGTSTEGA